MSSGHRYYVSFSFQASTGLGIMAMDITVPAPISGAADVAVIREHFIRQGYADAIVLGFSPYAPATPAPQVPAR